MAVAMESVLPRGQRSVLRHATLTWAGRSRPFTRIRDGCPGALAGDPSAGDKGGKAVTQPGRTVDAAIDGQASRDVLTVFSVMWAVATLFHVWVTVRSAGVVQGPTLLGAAHVVLSGAALAVLWRPRALVPLVVLALAGIWTCWLEAPVLGNHWLLAAMVNLGLLMALLVSRRSGFVDPARIGPAFFPMARATLIAFYVFAAFSKLNSAFLDASVSCASYFAQDLRASLHLGFVDSSPDAGWVRLMPLSVIAIEVAIPLLLVIRRTRQVGVVVGLVYHSIVAANMVHPFADFSSGLAALFVLFLPPAFAVGVVDLARRHRRRAQLAHLLAVAAGGIVVLALWFGHLEVARRVFFAGRAWAWVAVDVAVLALVLRFLRNSHAAPSRLHLGLRPTPRSLVVIPALVVLNGLSPYLEIKTSYAWNMYSNLQTVDGRSNHLLVVATLPLSDVQQDLVRILASTDPALRVYATERFDIPFLQLRAYLHDHPNVSLVYERHGRRYRAEPAAADPALVEGVPSWQEKLTAFRAVDQSEAVRCQPSFLPAH